MLKQFDLLQGRILIVRTDEEALSHNFNYYSGQDIRVEVNHPLVKIESGLESLSEEEKEDKYLIFPFYLDESGTKAFLTPKTFLPLSLQCGKIFYLKDDDLDDFDIDENNHILMDELNAYLNKHIYTCTIMNGHNIEQWGSRYYGNSMVENGILDDIKPDLLTEELLSLYKNDVCLS